jgi:hypothetical protein
MTKKRIDRGLLFLIALSSAICVESYKLGLGTYGSPKPGFFPFLLGILLGGLATATLLASLFAARPAASRKRPIPMRRMLALTANVLAYPFLLDRVGFSISTAILIAFLLKVLEAKSWWITVSVAIGVSFITHFFFKGVLRVQLPQGFLVF